MVYLLFVSEQLLLFHQISHFRCQICSFGFHKLLNLKVPCKHILKYQPVLIPGRQIPTICHAPLISYPDGQGPFAGRCAKPSLLVAHARCPDVQGLTLVKYTENMIDVWLSLDTKIRLCVRPSTQLDLNPFWHFPTLKGT